MAKKQLGGPAERRIAQARPAADEAPHAGTDANAAISAPRIVIERLSPLVDAGRYPARAVVGQIVTVEADIFMDGHEQLAADLLWRSAAEAQPQRVPMR